MEKYFDLYPYRSFAENWYQKVIGLSSQTSGAIAMHQGLPNSAECVSGGRSTA